jgi:shikimate kinase
MEQTDLERRTFSNVALIGFMGVGKSTCGRSLAAALYYDFFDTDQAICEQVGCSIPDIFKNHGEKGFRSLENKLVLNVLPHLKNSVIATGGGLGANSEYLKILRKNSFIVHLCLPPELIYERVKHNNNRPLLQTNNPLEQIQLLLEKRLPVYRTADMEVMTQGRSVSQIVFQILLNYSQSRITSCARDKGENQVSGPEPRF